MAKRRKNQASRQLDVDDLVALVGALNTIRNGNGKAVEDPSVNVKALNEASIAALRSEAALVSKYEEKIRDQDRKWQDRMDAQKDRSNELRFVAEQSRNDALRAADAATVASALVQVTSAATTLATATATQNDTTAKAIVALQLVASSSGSTLSGRETQAAETRQTRQWEIGIYVTVGIAAALGIARLLGWIH